MHRGKCRFESDMSTKSRLRDHSNCPHQKHNISSDMYHLSLEHLDNTRDLPSGNDCGSSTLRGINLTVSRLHGLAVKKALYCIRSLSVVAVQTTVPLCIMWIVLAILEQEKLLYEKLRLTNTTFDDATVVYTVTGDEESTTSKLAEAYRDTAEFSRWKSVRLTSKLSGSLDSINLLVTSNYVNRNAVLIGAIFESKKSENLSRLLNMTTLYNVQAYHSEPIAVAAVMKALHRYCIQEKDNITHHVMGVADELDLAIQPLPSTSGDDAQRCAMMCQKLCIHSSIAVLVSMTFLTSMFAAILVKERMVGSKHIQYLSGVYPLTYYLSTLLLDAIVYTLECVIVFSTLAYFSNFKYMYQKNGINLVCVLMSYGVASLPLIYAAQALFRNPYVCVLVIFSVRVTVDARFHLDNGVAWPVRNDFRPSLGRFIPAYCLLATCYAMCINFECRSCLTSKVTCANNPVLRSCEETSMKDYIIAPIMAFIWWTAIFLLCDSEIVYLLRKRIQYFLAPLKAESAVKNTRHGDEDVEEEYRRIENKCFKEFIILKNIRKSERKKIIIENISIAISQGECFCILGREKAGKSTLMEILTGRTHATSGRFLVDMQEKISVFDKGIVGMSFCPQIDALMNELTGEDTLSFYGRLRGVPAFMLKSETQTLMTALNISAPNRLCGSYSATDKKKINIAIALIGEPKIVVLDEPTLGLDYSDKKIVWQLLSRAHRLKRTVIVATSNAEECAALCKKMSIMVEGSFVCLTSPSALYKKYGTGYTVILIFETDENGCLHSQMPFLNFLVDAFTNVEIISDYGLSRLTFPDKKLNLEKLFAVMEDGVRYFHVMNYSVQKTSLKHILLNLSVFPEEEYIEMSHPPSPSFDRWPPKVSSLRLPDTIIN